MMKRVLGQFLVCLLAASGAWAQYTTDLELVIANMGKVSGATNAEVLLYPNLVVDPPRKTVLPGEEIDFTATGGTNEITWFFIDNHSGASMATTGVDAVRYTAGVTSAVIDVVEAWDGENRFGRAYVNIISAEEVARLGRAVIVAGGQKKTDPVWIATSFLTHKAYDVLRYRGFSDATIQYLSFDPSEADVDSRATLATCEDAFSSWAAHSQDLFVYLCDHGSDSVSGDPVFRLNPTQFLGAVEFDGWLDDLQDTYTNDVTVLLDFCYAGDFMAELTYTGEAQRIVVSATGPGEKTYFNAGGLISFSDAFWNAIMLGFDVYEAFLHGQQAVSVFQLGSLDDNGDGIYDVADGPQAQGFSLGASFVAGKDIPVIGRVLGDQLLTEGTEATLWADDVVASYPIDRVWSAVINPTYTEDTNSPLPVIDIPEIDLGYSNHVGRYQATYAGFNEQGPYKIIYYAKDIWNSVSLPRQSQVIQDGYDDHVIVVAGAAADTNQALSIRNLGQFAFQMSLA
jgi:hypothetical protein